jgi:hypothetical protein
VLAIGPRQIALRPRPRRLEISGAVEG